jgi:hypothetical protein
MSWDLESIRTTVFLRQDLFTTLTTLTTQHSRFTLERFQEPGLNFGTTKPSPGAQNCRRWCDPLGLVPYRSRPPQTNEAKISHEAIGAEKARRHSLNCKSREASIELAQCSLGRWIDICWRELESAECSIHLFRREPILSPSIGRSYGPIHTWVLSGRPMTSES